MSSFGGGYGHASRSNRSARRGQQSFNGRLSSNASNERERERGTGRPPASTSSSIDFVPEQPAIANGTQHETFRQLNDGSSGGPKGRRRRVTIDKMVLPSRARAGSGDAEGSSEAAASATANQDEEDDDAVCFICTEPIKYYAVGVCNHRTCHTCSLRLRALYKTLNCTFCKVRLFPSACSRTVLTDSRIDTTDGVPARRLYQLAYTAVHFFATSSNAVRRYQARLGVRDQGTDGRLPLAS